ncbi:MAG: VWA domain-containing protein [Acidobacteriia bacterium]|nr:VWA domain-containing protein [Terriglobia bacterium]
MRCLRRIVLFSVVTLPVSMHSRITAQDQRSGQAGTIRVRVRLIPVDVIVTDSHDRPVTDLKQENFQIFENGRPQQIRHFSIQTFSAATAAPEQPAQLRTVATLDLAPQDARTFVILLGRGRHGLNAVDGLIRFVRDDLLPQDRVAVRAFNRSSDFTTDHEQVVQILERYKKVNDEIESFLKLYGGFVPRFRKSYQPKIDSIFDGDIKRQLPSGPKMENFAVNPDGESPASHDLEVDTPSSDPVAWSGSADQETPAGRQGQLLEPQRIVDPFDELESEFFTLGLGSAFYPLMTMSIFDINNIYNCIQHMSFMQGEKHLLYFTANGIILPYGDTRNEEAIAAFANAARVAIDIFHTNGLVNFSQPPVGTRSGQPPMIPPIWGYTVGVQGIRNLSQLTGGRVAVFENLAKALDRINEITRVEYLLGYYPADEHWDGKYHSIKVKVNRPNLKVSFRHGYNATDDVQPVDRGEFLSTNRIIAAGASTRDFTGIAFTAGTSLTSGADGRPQLAVNLNIDLSTVGLKIVDTLRTGKLRIAIFYADAKQHYLGEEWKTMDLQLRENGYQGFMQSGIPCAIPIPLKAQKGFLKVVVYDMITEQAGSKVIKY